MVTQVSLQEGWEESNLTFLLYRRPVQTSENAQKRTS